MKYQNIIDNMTLKEKAAFLSGKSEWQTRDFPRLDIPAIFCSDGPNGVRKQAGAGDHLGINPAVPATCFPTAAAMANSWDEELEQRVGVALGEESMEEDVNVLLGPGLNIKRNPMALVDCVIIFSLEFLNLAFDRNIFKYRLPFCENSGVP